MYSTVVTPTPDGTHRPLLGVGDAWRPASGRPAGRATRGRRCGCGAAGSTGRRPGRCRPGSTRAAPTPWPASPRRPAGSSPPPWGGRSTRVRTEVVTDAKVGGSVIDPTAFSGSRWRRPGAGTAHDDADGSVMRSVRVVDDGRSKVNWLDLEPPSVLPADTPRDEPVVLRLEDARPRVGRFLVIAPGAARVQLLSTSPNAYPVSKVTADPPGGVAVVEVVNADDAAGFRLVRRDAAGRRLGTGVPRTEPRPARPVARRSRPACHDGHRRGGLPRLRRRALGRARAGGAPGHPRRTGRPPGHDRRAGRPARAVGRACSTRGHRVPPPAGAVLAGPSPPTRHRPGAPRGDDHRRGAGRPRPDGRTTGTTTCASWPPCCRCVRGAAPLERAVARRPTTVWGLDPGRVADLLGMPAQQPCATPTSRCAVGSSPRTPRPAPRPAGSPPSGPLDRDLDDALDLLLAGPGRPAGRRGARRRAPPAGAPPLGRARRRGRAGRRRRRPPGARESVVTGAASQAAAPTARPRRPGLGGDEHLAGPRWPGAPTPGSPPWWPAPRHGPTCSGPTTSPASGVVVAATGRRERDGGHPGADVGRRRAAPDPASLTPVDLVRDRVHVPRTSCPIAVEAGSGDEDGRGRGAAARPADRARGVVLTARGVRRATAGSAAAGPRWRCATASRRCRSAGPCPPRSGCASTATTAGRSGATPLGLPAPSPSGAAGRVAARGPRPVRGGVHRAAGLGGAQHASRWRRPCPVTCSCRRRAVSGPAADGSSSPTPTLPERRAAAQRPGRRRRSRRGRPGRRRDDPGGLARRDPAAPFATRLPAFSADVSRFLVVAPAAARAQLVAATSNTYPASEVTAAARRHRGARGRGRAAGRGLPAGHLGPAGAGGSARWERCSAAATRATCGRGCADARRPVSGPGWRPRRRRPQRPPGRGTRPGRSA